MPEASTRSTWPNPARTPLLLLIGLLAVLGYGRWIAGTGGLDPAQLEDGGGVTAFEHSRPILYPLHWLVLPALVLLAGGLIAGAVHTGPAGVKAGMRFLLGSTRPRCVPGAALFLAACARLMAWGGIAVGIGACGLMEFADYRSMHHEVDPRACSDLIFSAYPWAIGAPLAGILLGRVIFGALAEGARIRSEDRRPPVFSRVQDLALVGLFVVPWYLYCFFTRYQ